MPIFVDIRYFVKTLGLAYQNAALVTFGQEIPLTVKTAKNILGLILIIVI